MKKKLEEMTIEEMEKEIGFVDEPRRDLIGRSFTEKQTILEREGLHLWPTGEATKIGTEEVVSLMEADHVKPAPPAAPPPPLVAETKPDTSWIDTWGKNWWNQYGQ